MIIENTVNLIELAGDVLPAEVEKFLEQLILEPLGTAFEKVLFENLWELYES